MKIGKRPGNYSNLQRSSFAEPVPTLASGSCSSLTDVEPFVVFCCWSPSLWYRAHWNAFLLTTVGKIAYSSYNSLPVVLNQSDHCPRTFSSTRGFHVRTAVLWMLCVCPTIFYFTHRISEILRAALSTVYHGQSHWEPSDVWCWPLDLYLNSHMHCTDAKWLVDNCINVQVYRYSY